MMIAEHQALAQRGAELVELRLDWLSKSPDLNRLLSDRPTPVVVTCRRPIDGGRSKMPEEQRLTVLRQAIVAGVEYVDIEDEVARKIRRRWRSVTPSLAAVLSRLSTKVGLSSSTPRER